MNCLHCREADILLLYDKVSQNSMSRLFTVPFKLDF